MARMLDESNQVSCYFLSTNGYDGDSLQVEVEKVLKHMVIVPHLQEQILLISEAKNHGSLFYASG